MAPGNGHLITTLDQLAALYDAPSDISIAKELDHVSDHYRAFIEAAPFFALATGGPEGLDCSPRGDAAGFVRVADRKTLMVPDRRGNNRIDSLRNIVRDPRVALLFLIPGIGETIRVVGRAALSVDPRPARELRGQRQAALLRDRDHGRAGVLSMHQGDHPLQAVGCGPPCGARQPAHHRHDPGRANRRPPRRRGA